MNARLVATKTFPIIAGIALLTGAMAARAQTLTWDADTATSGPQDGSGTWNNTGANWWNGTTDIVWSSAIPNAAIFGATNGTAGVVTLGEPVISGNIRFNPSGGGNYTIAGGGNTLGLTNRGIYSVVSAEISANIVGTAITVNHGPGNAPVGTLTLSGNNTQTGALTIGENANNPDGQGAPNTTASVRLTSGTAAGTGPINFNGQGNATSPRLELAGGITVTNVIGFAGRNNVSTAIESFNGANTLSGPINPSPGGSQYPIRVDGSSTLNLAGTLTVQTGGPRAIMLGGTGNGTFNGILAGGSTSVATIIVNKAGSGAWTFAGPNTYVGSYVLSEGTLNLDYSGSATPKLAPASPLYLSAGTLNLNGGSVTEILGSTIIAAGETVINRGSGTSTLRMNSITRREGGVVNFNLGSIADTDTSDVNGILGGYATVAGADWAHSGAGAANTPIIAYTGYTDIAALGSSLPNSAAANMRLNSAGAGGNIGIGAGVTINTLLQNTTTAATIDTSSGTLRLGAIGGVLIPSGKQGLTIGTAFNSGTLTAGGADNTPGEIVLINNSDNPLVVNSVIADNGAPVAVVKAGSGSATLNGNNSHSGTNYIVGGTLNFSFPVNLGSGPVVVNNGTLSINATMELGNPILLGPSAGYGNGTIAVPSGQTVNLQATVANNTPQLTGVSLAGSLTKTGPGTLVLGAANTYTYGTIINEGTLVISVDNNLGGFDSPSLNGASVCYRPDNIVINGGTLEIASAGLVLSANRGIRLGPINGSGGGTLSVPAGMDVTFNGQISDNWNGFGSLTKTGDGLLVLGGSASDYSGDTTISAGTLQLNHGRAIPSGTGKGNLVLNGNLTLNDVRASLNGLSGNGTIDNMGFVTGATLVVGNNNASSTFAGTIQNVLGAPISFMKVGSGTLTLSGALSYVGDTTVAGGTLTLSGAASLSASTNIILRSGGTLNASGVGGLTRGADQTLSGAGTVSGNITSTGSTISPGSSAGTLNVSGNLTLSSSSVLNYELSNVTTTGGGVNDLIAVTGQLNLSGPTTLNVTFLNGAPGLGTYTLIQYGSFAGNIANLVAPPGYSVTNNTTAQAIQLVVTHVPAALTWRGDGSANVWDVGITPNWLQGGSNQVFLAGDSALFDDTGFNTPAVNIASPVAPGAVTVNSSLDYTFTGSGIASGSLTKSGVGTLVLDNNNTYSGPTVISGGGIQIGAGGTTGTPGTGFITNNGGLSFNRGDAITVGNSISGTGSVTNLGSSTVILTASNSYSGLTYISSGIVTPRNSSALGTDAGGTIVNAGGQLFIDVNINFTNNEALALSGGGPGNGAIRKGGGGVTTWNGPISFGSDPILHVDGGATLNLASTNPINAPGVNLALSGDGVGIGNLAASFDLGTGSLTKNGGANWQIAPTNNYTGKTIINGGILRISNSLDALGPVSAPTPDYLTFAGGRLGFVTNITATLVNDDKGFVLGGDGGFDVPENSTVTLLKNLTGAGNLVKSGFGTLVLAGTNEAVMTTLFLDRGGDGNNNDGITRVVTREAITNFAEIRSRNSSVDTAAASLELAVPGGIDLLQPLFFTCRRATATNPSIRAVIGANTISGFTTLLGGGDTFHYFVNAGASLVIANGVQFGDAQTANRNIIYNGFGDILVNGEIMLSANGVTPVSVIKDGPNTVTLAATNGYSGTTTISNGLLHVTGIINSTGLVSVVGGSLSGTGTINSPVTVLPGGGLSPGASVGTLTINNVLVLGGTTFVEVNKQAGTKDLVTGLASVGYGGTLVVSNIAGTLQVNDSFQIFNSATFSNNFASIVGSPGAGMSWSFNPTNGTVSVVAGGLPATPTNITTTVTSSNITLSWPENYTGWILQAQTNGANVGISNNWVTVQDSASTNVVTMPINRANPSVFYRLRTP
jgi:fibronectin-binding autotransporter adhesin